MLLLSNVKKSFEQTTILNGVNLAVPVGKKVSIIGPSGSGKSTILKLILGLLPLDEGTIRVADRMVNKDNAAELYAIRKNVGLLFQSAALFDSMTIDENVGFSLRELPSPYTAHDIDKKVDRALARVGMQDKKQCFPSELSGGQQKRVGLARMIINEPSYLLYDEPTTGLDPVLSTNIERLIVSVSQELNAATIVVTHQLSTILNVSDAIYFLDKGVLLEPETPATIMESASPLIYHFMHGKDYEH